MAIDISTLYSMYGGLLGGTSSPTANSTSANYSTSFADYFLKATSSSATNETNQTSSLFSELSSFGTSSALQGLLGSSSTNATSALTSYLSTSSTSSYGDDSTATNTFSDYLQSNFQAQQMKMLTAAKDNLQAKTTKYEASIADDQSTAAQLRLEQMNKNVSLLNEYLTQKTTEATTNSSLMSQLSSSSALTQYLASKNSSF